MYKLSKEAANDIDDILSYSITHFGLEQTETYYQSLDNCLELLGNNPERGASVDDLRKGYRCFQHESHIVFYIPREHDILIVRILHRHMDHDTHLEN